MSSPHMGAVVRLVHASVCNPLADRINVASHSGGCHITSRVDRDVILINKENVIITDLVSHFLFGIDLECFHLRYSVLRILSLFSFFFLFVVSLFLFILILAVSRFLEWLC